MDQLPRLGKRELICLLLFTSSCVVSFWRGILFLCVLGMDCVISLWHSLSLPYNHFTKRVWSFFESPKEKADLALEQPGGGSSKGEAQVL